MEKISLSNVVNFKRKKSASTRQTLVKNLSKPKVIKDDEESGGDYWVHSLSTISSIFANSDMTLLSDKIDFINKKHDASPNKGTKDMYNKNVEILHNFEDYDFSKLKPAQALSYLAKPQPKSIITVRGVPIQVRPQHVFSFTIGDKKFIGAVWFVSKLRGYSKEELGMFSESIFQYLSFNHGDEYEVNPKFCTTIDVGDLTSVNFNQLLTGEIAKSLNPTLDEIAAMI